MNTSLHHPNDDATTPVLVSEGFAKPAAQASPKATWWLALGAVASPVLFVLAWLVLGLLRPGYSPLRQQISDLALGADGLFMGAAFVLSGLLLLAGVVGIFRAMRADVGTAARWICAVLLALSPLGGVVVGVFNETAVAGHVMGAMLAFQTPIVSFLVTGLVIRRSPHWRHIGNWLLLGSPLTLVLVVVFLQTAPPGAAFVGVGLGGLTERVMLIEIHAWYVALGWLAFRRASRSAGL
jgi:hypothetical membrane protein